MLVSLSVVYLWRAPLLENLFVPASFCHVSHWELLSPFFLRVCFQSRKAVACLSHSPMSFHRQVSTCSHLPTTFYHLLPEKWGVFPLAWLLYPFTHRSVRGNRLDTIITSVSTDHFFRLNIVSSVVWDQFVMSLNHCWAIAVSPCSAPPVVAAGSEPRP